MSGDKSKQNKATVSIKKLVRDESIEILKKEGITVDYINIGNKERLPHLINKLQEEVQELYKSKGKKDIKEEMVDVFSVFLALTSNMNINISELQIFKDTQFIFKGPKTDNLLNYAKQINQENTREENILLLSKFFSLYIIFTQTVLNIGLDSILTSTRNKNKLRGAFKKGIYINTITGDRNNHVIDKYIKSGYDHQIEEEKLEQ